MLLSNILSNKLDDFVDNFDKEDVISCHQNRNAIIPQLPDTEMSRVAGYFGPEEGIKNTNRDMSHVSFSYQGIIIYN